MPPVLPPELLQEIVDAYSQLDDSTVVTPTGQRLWSPSMLALLSASRQLRLCVIRHIFRDIDIVCGKACTPADKLQQLILPDSVEDLPLGSIAPYIKSLNIRIYDQLSDLSVHTDEPSQHFHNTLLDSIVDKSPISTLSLRALVERDAIYHWDALPPDFQRRVTSLILLPSMEVFEIEAICGLNGELFRDTPLQELSIRNSLDFNLFNNPLANMPAVQNHHIVSLTIQQSGIPEALSLPNLQHLSATYLPLRCLDGLWRIVTSSWKFLTSLEIDNGSNDGKISCFIRPAGIN